MLEHVDTLLALVGIVAGWFGWKRAQASADWLRRAVNRAFHDVVNAAGAVARLDAVLVDRIMAKLDALAAGANVKLTDAQRELARELVEELVGELATKRLVAAMTQAEATARKIADTIARGTATP